ncbi:MAG: AlpA family phage regulatory protein [Rhodocyclales bacterium]|nr:AlpA family phage regulatory protein [Rhodocyclales bacterium]
MDRKVLKMSAVEEAVGGKKSKIYEEIANERFPKPIAIFGNGRARGWLSTEIQAYIDQRVAERDALNSKNGADK